MCGASLGENPLVYWCSRCYADWKEAILNKEPWTVFLVNLESRRRYREWDMRDLGIMYIYIGDRYDIAVVNGKNKLIKTEEFYEEGG